MMKTRMTTMTTIIAAVWPAINNLPWTLRDVFYIEDKSPLVE